MALPGDVCIGQRNVCVLRAAQLDDDCSPLGGNNSGVVTVGIVTMTASAEIEEGTIAEPKTGCGDIAFTVADPDVLKRYNVTGEILFHDVEMMYILFGGTLINGAAGGDFAGLSLGWASPGPDTPRGNGVYLEVISQNIGQGLGECGGGTSGFAPYAGHIFGKVLMTLGDRTFENDVANVSFTGKAFQNPHLFNGPWNDWPGAGYIPTAPYVTVGYSSDEYDAILATAGCGYQNLPAAS